jgi:F-type H+-transporting ATPase subunit a
MARVAFPYVLAVIVLVVFVSAGMRKHGVGGYLKTASMPPGLPKAVYPLVVPMEFASTFLIRPVTLSLRLFANMFAGHLLILVFALGGAYLLTQGPLMAVFGVTSMGFGVLISFLKLLIAFLQAYIFTLLAALYIAGATADEH